MPTTRIARHSRRGLVGLVALVSGCGEPSEPWRPSARSQASAPARDQLRPHLRESLETALADPLLARAHERALSSVAAGPLVIDAAEKLLARVEQAPRLERPSADFFAALQDTPGMRAALAEFVAANPELELDAIAAGFVGHVLARVTRPELVARLEQRLAERLASVGHALACGLLRDAGGLAALADAGADALVGPALADELAQRLGSDPAQRAERIERRVADPHESVALLLAWSDALASEAGVELLAALLDDEALAPLVADALARVLADAAFRSSAAAMFELALAPELDLDAIDRSLDALLALPVVAREAAALLPELARVPSVRARVDGFVAKLVASPAFTTALLDVVD